MVVGALSFLLWEIARAISRWRGGYSAIRALARPLIGLSEQEKGGGSHASCQALRARRLGFLIQASEFQA